MGNSIFGIGVSALLTSQRALGTVSHNIANVNNPAYSRQRNEISTREPQFFGGGYRGTGSQITDIRRAVDDFLVNEVRVGTSSVTRLDTLNDLAARLDNLVASPDAGVSPAIDRFFAAIQDVADDPVSSAPRSVLLSEARSLVQRFDNLDRQFEAIEASINTRIGQDVRVINDLAASLADLNSDIRLATAISTTSQPNDLLDQRDELLRQMSELVEVNVIKQEGEAVTVTIGNGQPMVVGSTANQLTVVSNDFDPTRAEVAVAGVAGNPVVSQFIKGGDLGGLLDARSDVVDQARNVLGRVAVALSDAVNTQHAEGLDLQGNPGGAFFGDLVNTTATAAASSNNTGTGSIAVRITDVGQLTTSDYRLENNGGTLTVTRLSDGTTTDVTADLAALPALSTTTVDGIEFSVTGNVPDGDRFLIRPTRFASRDFDTVIGNTEKIAAAARVTGAAGTANAGLGTVSAPDVVDSAAFVADDYTIVTAAATAATAGGGEGTINDANNNDNLSYELRINGITVYTQSEAAAPLADAAALAAVINDDVGTTGVRAYVEGGNLFLAREPANTGDIVVTEALVGASDAGDGVTGYFGSGLAGSGAGATANITLAADADSYVILDGAATPIQGGSYSGGTPINFNGIEVTVSGSPVNGDVFTVSPNTFGVGDNRNALALADLQIADILNGQTSSFQEAYGELVVKIGSEAREATINLSAQQTLLDNTVAARSEVSGVNLDEEAADLLAFQQSYQAAAQIIATADTIFQELLSVARG